MEVNEEMKPKQSTEKQVTSHREVRSGQGSILDVEMQAKVRR